MTAIMERMGSKRTTHFSSTPLSKAQRDTATDCIRVLQSLVALDDLRAYSDNALLEALRFALANGGYESASELCEVLERRGTSGRAERALRQARAQLDAVFGGWPRELGVESGPKREPETVRNWLRRGRLLASPERWLCAHNARLRSSPSDLSAFNRYLRHFSPLRATNAGTATPWLRGMGFSRAPRSETGPLVSVFIAARNARATIEYAVDSILQQTYTNLEVLICDDASSDDTLSVLMRRYGRDPRVRIYRSLAQQGPYNVKNTLLERALGEFVTTHDADDFALPTRISWQIHATRCPGVVGSIARWLRLRGDGSVVFFADGRARRLCIASLLVRREQLREIGGYPPARAGADLDVYGRLKSKFGAHVFRTIDAPQVLGLWETGSLTRSSGLEALETGYRSPLRRAYSERVFRRDVLGIPVEQVEPIQVFLARTGNFLEPQRIEAITAR